MNLLLSICIPTYNQADALKATLDSLIGENLESCEIIIRDDSPGMESAELMKSYENKLPIQYFHMAKEGIDKAFLFLNEAATGEYIWWFGDDIMSTGVVEKILKRIEESSEPDLLYIDSSDINANQSSIGIETDYHFKDRNDALNQLRDQLGFCSALLFRSRLLKAGNAKAIEVIGTSWVTLYLAFYVLVHGKNFHYLSGNNFYSHPKLAGEKRWYDPFTVHCINFHHIVNLFKNYFDKKVISSLLNKKLSNSWRAVIVERAMGYRTGFASPAPKIIPMLKCYWSYPQAYLAAVLMMIPSGILTLLYNFYKKIRKI